MKIRSRGEKIFQVINVVFMLLMILITFYPLWYTLACSFSDARSLIKHIGPLILPIQPYTLQGYELTLSNASILISLKNSGFYVVVGTLLSLLLTIFAAFAISRKYFLPRNILMKAFLLTMFFQGGIIPLFFVVRWTGIYNTAWAMILPYLVHTYYLIILRTFFASIPDSLEEAARIDGANEMHVLFLIFIPLALPGIAVVMLYYAVGYWNSWYPALMFQPDRTLWPLQMILREVLVLNDTTAQGSASQMVEEAYYRELVKYCTVVVATVPILVVYPFLQRYFIKGVMIGAIKG
ncbi:MAG: carbohydrate ABC transporter permease [Christensenellales bacterium]|jgi:putative aldouronate transport system permease protein